MLFPEKALPWWNESCVVLEMQLLKAGCRVILQEGKGGGTGMLVHGS